MINTSIPCSKFQFQFHLYFLGRSLKQEQVSIHFEAISRENYEPTSNGPGQRCSILRQTDIVYVLGRHKLMDWSVS